MTNILRAAVLTAVAWLTALWNDTTKAVRAHWLWVALEAQHARFAAAVLKHQGRPMGTSAFVSLTPIMGIAASVLVTIVTVLLLSLLAPDFFGAVADLTGTLMTVDLNNTLANSIARIIAILVPLSLLFGYTSLIFAVGVITYKKTKGGL